MKLNQIPTWIRKDSSWAFFDGWLTWCLSNPRFGPNLKPWSLHSIYLILTQTWSMLSFLCAHVIRRCWIFCLCPHTLCLTHSVPQPGRLKGTLCSAISRAHWLPAEFSQWEMPARWEPGRKWGKALCSSSSFPDGLFHNDSISLSTAPTEFLAFHPTRAVLSGFLL